MNKSSAELIILCRSSPKTPFNTVLRSTVTAIGGVGGTQVMLVVNQTSWTHTLETVIQQMTKNPEALKTQWEFSCEVRYVENY